MIAAVRHVNAEQKRKTERSVKYWAITALFFFIALSLSGIPPDQRKKSIWFFLSADDTGEAAEIREIVFAELKRELEREGFSILSEQAWRAKLSPEELSSLEIVGGSNAEQLAEKLDVALLLTGSIEVERRDITIELKAYDVLTKSLIFSSFERESKDIGIYNKVSSLSGELIQTLLNWADSQPEEIGRSQSESSTLEGKLLGQPPDQAAVSSEERVTRPEAQLGEKPTEEPSSGLDEPDEAPVETNLELTEQAPVKETSKIRVTILSNDEGAQVYLGSGEQAGAIENGKLVVEVPENIALTLEIQKPGYRPNREDFDLQDRSVEIHLRPLIKKTRFGFELFTTSSQFLGLGAGFRFYVIPDFVLVKADNYIYFSKSADSDESAFAFHDDLRFQIGSYLFSPPNRRFRWGAATGIGVIFSKISETPTHSSYLDLYLDLINLWLDFNWDKGAIFCRVETKYALGMGDCLLEPGFMTGYGPQFTIGWLWKL
jgi:hypothetical protein